MSRFMSQLLGVTDHNFLGVRNIKEAIVLGVVTDATLVEAIWLRAKSIASALVSYNRCSLQVMFRAFAWRNDEPCFV